MYTALEKDTILLSYNNKSNIIFLYKSDNCDNDIY